MEGRINELIKQAHNPLNLLEYDSTNVRDNTNCYSHAIGVTYPYLQIYRIGAISQLKSINERYSSKEEIINLLFEDLEILQLKYEQIFSEDDFNLNDNQFVIKLYAWVLPDGRISEYHFIRFEKGKWTEKRKFQEVLELYDKDMYENMYPWEHIITLKITR